MSDSKSPLDLFVLNEVSLPRLALFAARGRRPHIVAIEPLFRSLVGVLGRIADKMVARGYALRVTDAPLAVEIHDGAPGDSLYRPYHPGIEAGVRPLLDPDRDSPNLTYYAYAFRKALSDYSQQMLYLTGTMVSAEAAHGAGPLVLHGAPEHFARVYRLSAGRPPAFASRPVAIPRRLFNFAAAASVFAATILWLLARVRPRVREESFRLAVDRVSPVDMEVARLGVDSPGDVLIVERSESLARQHVPGIERYRRVTRDDARVPLGVAWALIGRLASDLCAIWRGYGRREPELFSRFAILAAKRVQFAAFFCRFRPAFFWGRDDYSLDHIVRNAELRVAGGVSCGVNHGLPMNTYVSQWREIDFDVYYTFGRHLYETFYRDSWSPRMKVKPVGNIQMTPERRARIGVEQTKDIAVYVIVSWNFEKFLDHMRRVAEHFSDRRVHMRMKSGREPAYMRRYAEWMARKAPPNMLDNTDPDAYELMLKTSYAITPASSTGVEAMQFGARAFYFDLVPDLEFYYFRNFPDLLVRSADDIIRRIEAIESGAEPHDRSRFEDLIALSAPDFYATLRGDLGAARRLPGTAS